jgi:hypothetical protein
MSDLYLAKYEVQNSDIELDEFCMCFLSPSKKLFGSYFEIAVMEYASL